MRRHSPGGVAAVVLVVAAPLVTGGTALLLGSAKAPTTADGAPAFSFSKVVIGGSPKRIEAGDLDGDGDVDLVVLGSSPTAAMLTVLRNDGGGTFTTGWDAVLPPGLDFPPDLEVGDLDGDGDVDLLTLVPFSGFGSLSSRLNAGDGTFATVVPLGLGGHRVDNELGDLDGDLVLDYGYYEIDLIGYAGTRKGSGDGTFPGFGPEIPVGGLTDTRLRGALGEVTGDALLDMVMASSNGLHLLRGEPDGGFVGWSFPIETLATGAFGDVFLTDLDGDGLTDAVATRPTQSAVAVLLGQPGGGLGSPSDFAAGSRPDTVVVADLGIDSVPDVVITRAQGGISVLQGAGGGALLPPVNIPVTRFASDVAAADLDGDGDVDLAVTDVKAGTVRLLFNLTLPFTQLGGQSR